MDEYLAEKVQHHSLHQWSHICIILPLFESKKKKRQTNSLNLSTGF